MKKLFFACCFIIAASAASFAQVGGAMMKPEDRAKQLQTQLKLTDGQTAKIKAILTAQAAAQAAKTDSMSKAGASPQAIRMALMKMPAATNAKIKAVLTLEQASSYSRLTPDKGIPDLVGSSPRD